jgi:hypothetical protein
MSAVPVPDSDLSGMPLLCLTSGDSAPAPVPVPVPLSDVARERASGGATLAMGLMGDHRAVVDAAVEPGLKGMKETEPELSSRTSEVIPAA